MHDLETVGSMRSRVQDCWMTHVSMGAFYCILKTLRSGSLPRNTHQRTVLKCCSRAMHRFDRSVCTTGEQHRHWIRAR